VGKALTFSLHELLLMLLYLEWPLLVDETVTIDMYVRRREIEKQLANALYYAITIESECCTVDLTALQARAIWVALYNSSAGARSVRPHPCVRALETGIYHKLRSVVE
jgi:GH24 family phage-related lysozyme (muramidase)